MAKIQIAVVFAAASAALIAVGQTFAKAVITCSDAAGTPFMDSVDGVTENAVVFDGVAVGSLSGSVGSFDTAGNLIGESVPFSFSVQDTAPTSGPTPTPSDTFPSPQSVNVTQLS